MYKSVLVAEEQQIFNYRMQITCLYFAAPIVMSFSVVDIFYSPGNQWQFFLARLFVIPVVSIAYLLTRIKWTRENFAEASALLLGLYLGVYHAYLVSKTGYETSEYYAGINLALVIGFGFLPWRIRFIPLVLLVSYGPYFFTLGLADHNLDLHYLIPHAAFMASTCVLTFTAFLITRELRKREIRSRIDLESKNQEQADVIQQKTREGVYLQRLANQFSPVIVEAIKKGDLNIDQTIQRSVTCFFLDVENSTQRSNRIEHANYVDLMGEFFGECIEILLRHEVTVGTFLGDGILAFANAPNVDPNHQQKVILASIEILKMHARKSRYYRERWRTDFNIRIGVETGLATIGFFPSRTRGVYTAIGETINLASRLCSRAQRNSVCVTKTFLKHLNPDGEVIKAQKHSVVTDFKGFENEVFELYSIIPNIKTLSEISSHTCILCSQPMHIEEDLGDCELITCVQCGYKDIVDKSGSAKLAA
jgi:class 3 adenylate cyclase